LGNPICQLAFAEHHQPEICYATQQQQQYRGNKGKFYRRNAALIADQRGTIPVH
jgi:deoxycytidine triphosphate deaminase